jgi:hypothetical protein
MFIEKILAEFPTAEELAYRRIFSDRTIFFDTKEHQPLPEFSEAEILAALIMAQVQAREIGQMLKLTAEEKRLWNRHFSSVNNSF